MSEEGHMLRKVMLAAALVSSVTATPVLAKGCVRGAIVGGIAGHYVGRGHALAGAAVGCLVARHHYAQKAKAQRTSPHR
jgi:outer membrane lipoprotein SlyB